MGRLQEAEATAQRASREQPDNAPILEAQGYLAVLRQDYAAGAASYEHALSIRPRSDQAHYNLAKLYKLLNRRAEAIVQAKMAVDLKPDPDYQRLLDDLQNTQ
jgi:tetratricopeptide (TPR) repeat protein